MISSRPARAALGTCLAITFALVAAAPAPAPVAPKSCGKIMDGRYKVKADQVRCAKAKRRSKRYIRSGWRPDGWSCKSYDSSTSLRFRCWRGQKTYFAIRL
jgi:hypothetical protein